MLLDGNFWIVPLLFSFSAMCLCDALASILMARESGIWNTGWTYCMANVTQRVQLSIVWAFHAHILYACFFYLTRRNFPTALSRQPVSLVGRLFVLETVDVPRWEALFSMQYSLLLSLAGDHQRQ